MSRIKKALIPVAGLGTRFLPITKSVPKEMLPIVDRPLVLHLVEEAARAGIEDIVLVTGRHKSAIEDFFDGAPELEAHLEKKGQIDTLKSLRAITSMANVVSVRQNEPLGLGHAVWVGHNVIGNEPFAVLLGDEIMWTPPSTPVVTGQLCELYLNTQLSTIGVMEVEASEVSKYGIVNGPPSPGAKSWNVNAIVEKPEASQAPSRWALPGRYVFSPAIFSALRESRPNKNGEIQLTDGMAKIANTEGMVATPIVGRRFDAGDKLGYLKANIELAMTRSDLGPSVKQYILQLAERLRRGEAVP
jgi:UTP--glucose-1-phosphate uridylyltransferase